MTTTYIDSDPRDAVRQGALHPRNYTMSTPVPVPRQPPRVISGILEQCRRVAQEYAAIRVFVRNPYQIYQLNTNAKKCMDELLSLLFIKFNGDVAKMSKVSDMLGKANTILGDNFKGLAAGHTTMGSPLPKKMAGYGLPEIVSLAIKLAGEPSGDFERDASDMRGLV